MRSHDSSGFLKEGLFWGLGVLLSDEYPDLAIYEGGWEMGDIRLCRGLVAQA